LVRGDKEREEGAWTAKNLALVIGTLDLKEWGRGGRYEEAKRLGRRSPAHEIQGRSDETQALPTRGTVSRGVRKDDY